MFWLILVLVQEAHLAFTQGLILSDVRSAGKPLMTNNDETINGSPYLSDVWGTGYAYVMDKIKSDNIPIRYDVYRGAAEIQEKNNTYILDPARIRGFKFSVTTNSGLQEYHFQNGFSQIKSISQTAYFEILFEGKNIFLKRYTKKLGYDASNYGSNKSRSFQDQNSFYVVMQSGDVIEFSENKNALLKAFPKVKTDINGFIRNQSIKISNSGDVRKLFEYVDTIL